MLTTFMLSGLLALQGGVDGKSQSTKQQTSVKTAQKQTPPPPGPPPKIEVPDKEVLVRNLTKKLMGLESLQGKFTLTIGKSPAQNGEFRLQKPDFFRITGIDIEQYFDGKTFVQYDRVAKVYERDTERKFSSLEYLPGYEAFYAMASTLIAKDVQEAELFRKEVWVVNLVPGEDVASSKIFVEKESELPLGWSVTYKNGIQTSLEVSELTKGTKFPASDFAFNPPADAKSSQQVDLTQGLLSIGDEVPAFTGQRYTGEPFKFAEYLPKTKATVVVFWYSDCEACKDAVPALVKRIAPLSKQKLGAVSINVADPPEVVAKRVKDWGLGMPNLLSPQNGPIVQSFKVVAFPTVYLVGPDGKVWMRSVGYDKAALDSGLKALGFK